MLAVDDNACNSACDLLLPWNPLRDYWILLLLLTSSSGSARKAIARVFPSDPQAALIPRNRSCKQQSSGRRLARVRRARTAPHRTPSCKSPWKRGRGQRASRGKSSWLLGSEFLLIAAVPLPNNSSFQIDVAFRRSTYPTIIMLQNRNKSY